MFHLEIKGSVREKLLRNYRNPICLAKEYQQKIISGEAKNESDLALKIGISRVRVNQMIQLVKKLDRDVVNAIEGLGDPMSHRYVSERRLRSIIKMPKDFQRETVKSILERT